MTARTPSEAQVKIVADLHRALRYSAEILLPAYDKASVGICRAFAIPPHKSLR